MNLDLMKNDSDNSLSVKFVSKSGINNLYPGGSNLASFATERRPRYADGSIKFDSNQIPEDSGRSSINTTEQIIEPPYNPMMLCQYLEKSSRLCALIEAKALNVCGHGWRVAPTKSSAEMAAYEQRAFIRERDKLLEILNFPNFDMSFSAILTTTYLDRESTGNGYIEVVRDRSGKVNALYHIPSHTIRIRSNDCGYIQIRDGNKKFYKKFGDIRKIRADDGTISEKKLKEGEAAHELIHIKIYSPRSAHYGIPRYVAAIPAISGNFFSARRNVVLFFNDAVPKMAIVVEGGEIAEEVMSQIETFLTNESKGLENAHRVMLVQALTRKSAQFLKEQVRIRFEKLSEDSEDASFQKYRENNDEEIRECFRLPRIFLGTCSETNRASAIIARQVANQQVFAPEQRELEHILNNTIVRDLGFKYVKIILNAAEVVDPLEKSNMNDIYAKHGGLSLNDLRMQNNMDPYPSEFDEHANLPVPIALESFRKKLEKEYADKQREENEELGLDEEIDSEDDEDQEDSKAKDKEKVAKIISGLESIIGGKYNGKI